MALAFFGLGLRSRSRTLEEIDRATVQEVDDADYRAYLAEREQRLVHLRLSSSAAAHDEAPPKSPGLRDDGKQLSNGKWYSQIKETVIEAEKSQHGDRDDTQQVEVELGLKQAMLGECLTSQCSHTRSYAL